MLNTNKVALTLGLLIGLWHLIWVVLVALGWAQPLLDFIFSLHMIANPYQVTGFDGGKAAMLVVITFVVGYVIGWVFATIWNSVRK